MTKRGRDFSGREGSHARLGGSGFGGTGYVGNEAAKTRSRVYLRVDSHINLFCSISYTNPFSDC